MQSWNRETGQDITVKIKERHIIRAHVKDKIERYQNVHVLYIQADIKISCNQGSGLQLISAIWNKKILVYFPFKFSPTFNIAAK